MKNAALTEIEIIFLKGLIEKEIKQWEAIPDGNYHDLGKNKQGTIQLYKTILNTL